MHIPGRRLLALLAVPAGIALAACTGPAPSSTSPRPTPSASPAPSPSPAGCPNAQGGACLGKLDQGTYTSTDFSPAITYTVPKGWQNAEDINGSFTLLPPGGSWQTYLSGHGSAIWVLSDVAAAQESCDLQPAGDVALTPEAIVGFLAQRPSLQLSQPTPSTVGGLSGLVVDVGLVVDQALPCFQSDPFDPAFFSSAGAHSVVAGPSQNELMRVYLLARSGRVTAVGVEADGGAHDPLLTDLIKIVESFSFDAGSGGTSVNALAR